MPPGSTRKGLSDQAPDSTFSPSAYTCRQNRTASLKLVIEWNIERYLELVLETIISDAEVAPLIELWHGAVVPAELGPLLAASERLPAQMIV